MKPLIQLLVSPRLRQIHIDADNILHALGASGPVAIMEIELFALKDECAEAILVDTLVLTEIPSNDFYVVPEP